MPQKSASHGVLNVCLFLWGMCKVSIRYVYKNYGTQTVIDNVRYFIKAEV